MNATTVISLNLWLFYYMFKSAVLENLHTLKINTEKVVFQIQAQTYNGNIPWNSPTVFLWRYLLLKARWVYQVLFDYWPSAANLKTAPEQLQTCQKKKRRICRTLWHRDNKLLLLEATVPVLFEIHPANGIENQTLKSPPLKRFDLLQKLLCFSKFLFHRATTHVKTATQKIHSQFLSFKVYLI